MVGGCRRGSRRLASRRGAGGGRTPTAPSPSSSCRRFAAVRVRRSRCGRPVRARCRLHRLPRAGARLARARPGRLVARRSRRRRRSSSSRTARPDHHLRLPAAARVTSQRHALSRRDRRSGLPRRAHVRARRGSTASSRSRTSRPLPTRSQQARRRRSGRGRDAIAAATLDGSTCGSRAPTTPGQGRRSCSSAGSSRFAALGILGRSAAGGPCRRARRSVALADGAPPPRRRHRRAATVVVRSWRSRRESGRCSSLSGREVLVPAVVALAACVPRRPRGLAGGQRARRDRPHPDGGGRFYGVTNQVGTLLLAPSLAAAAAVGVAGAVAIGLLLLVHGRLEPCRSRRRRSRGRRSGVRRPAGRSASRAPDAAAARGSGSPSCVAVGLAIVGADALLGGSSHVTDAVWGGPGTLLDDLDRRLRISWAGATSAVHTRSLCLAVARRASRGSASGAATHRRSSPMLVAIGVSLLVNDTPVDVLCYGALGCLALTAWAETRDRRAPLSERTVARPALQCPRAPRALTDRSRRTIPARLAVEPTVPSVASREAPGAVAPVRRPVRRDAVAAGACESQGDPVCPNERTRRAARAR